MTFGNFLVVIGQCYQQDEPTSEITSTSVDNRMNLELQGVQIKLRLMYEVYLIHSFIKRISGFNIT